MQRAGHQQALTHGWLSLMKVKLEKTFALPASADAGWTLLRDIERAAGCMPGACITERTDDSH